MKCSCVFLIVFAIFTINIIQIEGWVKPKDVNRQSNDVGSDVIRFADDDDSDELSERWGKKPGGWQKGQGKPGQSGSSGSKPGGNEGSGSNITPDPNGKPGQNGSTVKPGQNGSNAKPGQNGSTVKPGPNVTPNNEKPDKPRPTDPTVPKETRPAFATSAATQRPTTPSTEATTSGPTETTSPTPPNEATTSGPTETTSPTPPNEATTSGPIETTSPTPPNEATTSGPTETTSPMPPVVPGKDENTGTKPDNHEVFKCMKKCLITAEHEPVCGDNGVTYINPWHFRCAQRCKIVVETFSRGPCPPKPCDPDGSSSEMVKECISKCPMTGERDPVCGSNGITYDNYDRLVCARNCGVAVSPVSKGPCRGKEPPIDSNKDKETTPTPTTPSSSAVKECMGSCRVTSEYDPFCGSDGVTYTNIGRFMCAKNCGVNVVIVSKGVCPSKDFKPDMSIIRSTPPSPLAKACLSRCPTTGENNPVCGTDLVTYKNPGQLYCAQSCGSAVEVLRKGSCSDPPISGSKDEDLKPATPAPATPATPSATPSSVARECMTKCPSTPEYNPVCGTDYVTYNNPGKLHCAQRCGVDVKELRHGPCPTQRPTPATPTTTVITSTTAGSTTTQSAQVKNCMENRCPATPEYNPVCGTDYVTYKNPGRLNCAKFCGLDVTMLRHGPCPKTTPSATTATTPMTPAWRWE